MLIGWFVGSFLNLCLSEFEFCREYLFYNLIDYTVWRCQSIASVCDCGLDMCARCLLFVSLVSLASFLRLILKSCSFFQRLSLSVCLSNQTFTNSFWLVS